MDLMSVFISMLLLKVCRADKNILPTFLLDYEGSMRHVDYEPNPFNKLSSNDFADIVHSSIKRSECLIIFVEETFSIEDISVKDHLGTPFCHLRQGLLDKKVLYLPNVIEPYGTLNRILRPRPRNVFYLNFGSKLELPEEFEYIYVFFENGANESLARRLRKHDVMMKEVYFAVRQLKQGPVVAFYTGKSNPVVVERTEYLSERPIPVPKLLDVDILSEGALFRFSGVYVSSPTRRATFSQKPTIAEETWTRWKLSTKMTYTDFELLFNFNLEDTNWWILETVCLLEGGEEVGRTTMYASAPWDSSYVCGDPIVLINARDGSSVTISKYQIQPLRPYSAVLRNGSVGNDSTTFGPKVNCGPYFNSRILAGLMVTMILAAILACGFTALYDCSSNNRYDDPSGKQLMHEVFG